MGALFLHKALLAGLVITCGSPAISLCSFSFAETLFSPDVSDSGSLSAVSASPFGVLRSILRFLVFLCLSAADLLFQLWFTASVSGLQFRTFLRRRELYAMCVRPLFFSGSLSLHAALLTFSLHSVSFAVASVLQTISFAVLLPG